MTSKPQISVLMPVYNGERFIGKAIESLLNQTLRNFELVILNDASSDASIQKINTFNDKRIRLINSSKRLGLAKIRQKGLKECRSNLVAFLDCDDIALPERLEKQQKYLYKNPEISIIGSWIKVINELGKHTGGVFKHACQPEIIKAVLLFRNCFTQSAVMARKAVIQKYDFRSSHNAAPDFDLWARAAKTVKMANIPRVLTLYRDYKENLTFKTSPAIKNCTRRIFLESLLNLGFTPSDQEIFVHDSLERNLDRWDLRDLIKAKKWLQKLFLINGKRKVYDRNIFAQLLYDYWFKVCCLTAGGGSEVFHLYRDISFRKKVRTIDRDIILFILASLKKRKHIDITSNIWIKNTYRDL